MYIDEARFERLLTAALQRAAELDIEEMPSDEELDKIIQPSPRFERRMRALLRNPRRYVKNQKRPVYLRILRHVAAVVVAVTTLFGATMVISPQARATVIDFARSWYDDRTVYQVPNVGIVGEWTFDYIPEGFTLLREMKNELQISRVYQNETDELIRITISAGQGVVDNEHSDFYQTIIDGRSADVYVSNTFGYENIIVLHDEPASVFIIIISSLEIEEMLEIAKAVNS